MEYKI